MKLKIVEAKHTRKKRKLKAAIAFHAKGIICANVLLCELMELEPDDLLSFIQDQDNPKNWYIGRNLPSGSRLRYHTDNKTLYTANNGIKELIDESIGVAGKSYSFMVSRTPIDTVAYGKLYAILNGSLKMSIRDKGGGGGE
ncbi:MAG: hypothetical protein ACK5JU_04985 [Bacteroidales bacterium]